MKTETNLPSFSFFTMCIFTEFLCISYNASWSFRPPPLAALPLPHTRFHASFMYVKVCLLVISKNMHSQLSLLDFLLSRKNFNHYELSVGGKLEGY